jgi:hypothetical protein
MAQLYLSASMGEDFLEMVGLEERCEIDAS